MSAGRTAKTIKAKVDEAIRLRATADQLMSEASNLLSNEAAALADNLSYEDMAALLRALAPGVR